MELSQKLFWSIKETAEISGESTWKVKNLLRLGTYRARKSGRRTLVEVASVMERAESLPIATFTQIPAEKPQVKRPYRRRVMA
jgi:hypothetical protein